MNVGPLRVLAVQSVEITPSLRHLEIFTMSGLVTMLWHGPDDADRVVLMCGGAMGAAADDPMADKPAQMPQASAMCACCKNMAMMKSGMMGGQKDMPGMQMPK